MLINTKEVAALLFLENAFANQAIPEKILYEAKEVSGNFSKRIGRHHLGAYISAKTNAFIYLQKKIGKYLK